MASKLLSHMRGAKRQMKGAPDKPAKQAKKAAASSKIGAAVAGGSGSGSSSSTLSPGMAALFKDQGFIGVASVVRLHVDIHQIKTTKET